MRFAAICLFAGVCLGQQPTFDAASVKVAGPRDPQTSSAATGGPGTTDPGRIHYPRMMMVNLLAKAYGVEIDQISGPAWITDSMGKDLYQVDATMPPTTSQAHREARDFPGYELSVAKDGPKLKESAPDPCRPLS